MSRQGSEIRWLGLIAMALPLVGCGSSNQTPDHAWEIHVKAMGDISRKSVEVHLVGVAEREKTDIWDTTSMTEYWRPGNQLPGNKLRTSAMDQKRVTVLRFGSGKDPNQVYTDGSTDPDDPWHRWTAQTDMKNLYLMVLADLPGRFEDQPGDEDRRRLSLPLDPKRWKGHPKILKIEVHSYGLSPVTVPEPEKAKKRFGIF